MKKTHSFYLWTVAGGVALLALAAPRPISGQNTPSTTDAVELSPQMTAIISELTAQNKKLVANQAAMDTKIDELTETIRQARIFVSRAGKGGAK